MLVRGKSLRLAPSAQWLCPQCRRAGRRQAPHPHIGRDIAYPCSPVTDAVRDFWWGFYATKRGSWVIRKTLKKLFGTSNKVA